MSDWGNQFKTFNESVGGAAKSVYNMIDQWSFKMLVDCLKSDDFEAVSGAVDQLVKENRPLSVPPLYFVSRAHPNHLIRTKAMAGLKELGKDREVEELTAGKTVEQGTKILIETYGNYKGK